jgi:septum formation protein
MKLILASASPRRAEVLRDAGIAFEAVSTNIDESPRSNESPEELVIRLAEAKARSAAARLISASGPAVVLGADTEVVADGPGGRQVLGKPASAQGARAMLRRLSGRTHEVITGLFLIHLPGGVTRVEHETTRVTFAPLTDEEIDAYVATGEPFDKAGAYAIQGRGGRYVTRVEGCYFNVVGLPLARLYRHLCELGWQG